MRKRRANVAMQKLSLKGKPSIKPGIQISSNFYNT